jgi:tRNA U34 5-methylaminomethyl-2-thiouridine-forming methyltransferase MnmC
MSIKYQIIETGDGSHTLTIKDTDITFHSRKGAIQESDYIFIKCGVQYYLQKNPSAASFAVLEVGFGTGLNALLTAMMAARNKKEIKYTAIDLNPLAEDIYSKLNYAQILNQDALYEAIMKAPWDERELVYPFFKLSKINDDLLLHVFSERFDIIYFDAFAPTDQPEMWDDSICKKMFDVLNSGGALVTYCSKSVVRKAFVKAGFVVEKLPGPLGKRDIVRAIKP